MEPIACTGDKPVLLLIVANGLLGARAELPIDALRIVNSASSVWRPDGIGL